MPDSAAAGCARCGTIVDPHFRFCPECGLPASGESVMSTDIADLKRLVEAQSTVPSAPAWRRYVLPTIAAAMLLFVVLVGVVLFDRQILDRVLPAQGTEAAPATVLVPPRWEPEWVAIPQGTFPFGDPEVHLTARVPYPFLISKYEVTNGLWLDYLNSERRRLVESGLWDESFPRDVDGWATNAARTPSLPALKSRFPVRNVSPVAIAEFCAWVTRRLGEPGWEIRIPTRLEWEYAARGTEGRIYPWGNEFYIPPRGTGGKGQLRQGIFKGPYSIDDPTMQEDDTSPFGVVAMGVNVSEWTLVPELAERDASTDPYVEFLLDLPAVAQLRENLEDQDIKVASCGANYAQTATEAAEVATAWMRTTRNRRDSLPQVGIRLVKVRVASEK